MTTNAPTPRTLVLVFAGLLVLLAGSAASSFVVAGRTGAVLALGFAAAKTTLVFTFFMRLRYQTGLVRLFALAGFFWLGLIGVFVFADYFTRG